MVECLMAFLRTRTIKGRTYSYWQQSVRAGKKVRSIHLGKVPPEKVGLAYIERLIEKYPGDPFTSKPQDRSTPPATAQSPSQPSEQMTQGAGGQQGSEPSSEGTGNGKC